MKVFLTLPTTKLSRCSFFCRPTHYKISYSMETVNRSAIEIVVQHEWEGVKSESQRQNKPEKKKNAFNNRKFEVDGHMMKFKGEQCDDVQEMTLMVGPASTIASVQSQLYSNPKQMAEKLGIQMKTNMDYFLIPVKPKTSHFSHLALGLKSLKTNKVVISRIDEISYVSNILRIGDRILAINGQRVVDKVQCKNLILVCKGNFEALVERKKIVPETHFRSIDSFVFTQFVPLKCSYTPPNQEDPDHCLGNPLIGYEKLPKDVGRMVHKYIAGLKHKTNNNDDDSESAMIVDDSGKRVSCDKNALLEFIKSDVDPIRVLKSPKRKTMYYSKNVR